MKILSFIVPAYNSADFLKKCIDSMLVPELLDKLEILVINDGSTDGTSEIAAQYCNRYPETVSLISQENKGHGGALNTGCAAATGKYLKVVDADDWVETENLPELIRLLEACSADVVLTHYKTVDISTGEIKNWRCYPDKFGAVYTWGEIMSHWYDFDRLLTFHGILYRRDFYQKHKVPLSEHVFYEDHEYVTFPGCMAKSIIPLDVFLYNYRIGDVNQSVSQSNQLRRLHHTQAVLEKMLKNYQMLPARDLCSGRDFACRKIHGLLQSYIITALLVNPNRREGHRQAAAMLKLFRKQAPPVYALTHKQYLIFLSMHFMGLRKRHWMLIRESKWYNNVRRNHDYK